MNELTLWVKAETMAEEKYPEPDKEEYFAQARELDPDSEEFTIVARELLDFQLIAFKQRNAFIEGWKAATTELESLRQSNEKMREALVKVIQTTDSDEVLYICEKALKDSSHPVSVGCREALELYFKLREQAESPEHFDQLITEKWQPVAKQALNNNQK